MKKILITLLVFISFMGFSQTSGITYQALILNPSGEQLPGVNNSNAPLVNKYICLRFSIIDHNSQFEYMETIQTTTDEFGMVNLIIGTGEQIGGYAASFSNILWNTNPKKLKVDISTTGICSYYTEISNQPFTAVPFALFALNSESTAELTALQATVAANATAATTAIAAVQADVNQNEADGDAVDLILQNNITTLQNTVTSNATATTTALGLKEDAVNKSTTTTLGTSNVLFPTQNAVKTYVDTNITTINASNAALQATVASNATAATTAIAAVQADVNQNEADGDAADLVLQNNITTLQSTVTSNATATTTALGLKEDAVNKSTTTTLGTSNVLFPTQNAVKTYVDTNITTINASNAALQATVASNATAATTAIAAVQADVNQNEADGDAADLVLQNNITTLQSTVTSNATATTTALGLKEDAVNKSTTTTLGTSNVLFPTQNAVKTYVDTNITTINASNAALQATVASNATASTTAIAAVQADVDANEIDSDAADATLQNNITTLQNTVTSNATAASVALGLKENAANKSTDITLSDATNTKFPTELAVKTYVDNQVNNGTATNVSGIVAVANGGTGSATQNFVDLTSNQTIAGTKSFSANATFNTQTIGKGNASGDSNLAVGAGAMNGVSTGHRNTAIGNSAMQNYVGTSFDNNTSVGYANFVGLTTGSGNTSVGAESMMALSTGTSNTSIGNQSLINTTGSNNVGVGKRSGDVISTGNNNTIIGTEANVGVNNLNNATAIGYGAIVSSSNTIQLGNASVTNVNTKGSITANAEISAEITANLIINNANAEQYKSKVLICNPSNQITITFNNDLPVGFNCMVLQKSLDANKINLAGGAGVTLKNRNNYTATAGNYAIATIVNIGGGIIVTAGDMQ